MRVDDGDIFEPLVPLVASELPSPRPMNGAALEELVAAWHRPFWLTRDLDAEAQPKTHRFGMLVWADPWETSVNYMISFDSETC